MTAQGPSPTAPLRVTVQDIRTARYCLAGVRPWFHRQGLDWQAFLDAGIAADTLRATGDALIDPVIAAAKARVAQQTHPTALQAADQQAGAKPTADPAPPPRKAQP